jgi:hypothetical protein
VTPPSFRIELLGDAHDRALFRCGDTVLGRYFQTQATQDIRRRVVNCFVAVEEAGGGDQAVAALPNITRGSHRPPNHAN